MISVFLLSGWKRSKHVTSVSARTLSASKASHTRHKRQNGSSLQAFHETIRCEKVSLPKTLREFVYSFRLKYQVSFFVESLWHSPCLKIKKHLSNNKESRGEKRVVNYPNLSESVHLKRKRKMETETTSPRKRKRTENEVSKNSFDLNHVKT